MAAVARATENAAAARADRKAASGARKVALSSHVVVRVRDEVQVDAARLPRGARVVRSSVSRRNEQSGESEDSAGAASGRHHGSTRTRVRLCKGQASSR